MKNQACDCGFPFSGLNTDYHSIVHLGTVGDHFPLLFKFLSFDDQNTISQELEENSGLPERNDLRWWS